MNSPKKKKVSAFTLVEMLVSMAVLSVFLIVITDLFVTGYRMFAPQTQKFFLFRSAATGFDLLTSNLRACGTIYYPDLATGTTKHFSDSASTVNAIVLGRQFYTYKTYLPSCVICSGEPCPNPSCIPSPPGPGCRTTCPSWAREVVGFELDNNNNLLETIGTGYQGADPDPLNNITNPSVVKKSIGQASKNLIFYYKTVADPINAGKLLEFVTVKMQAQTSTAPLVIFPLQVQLQILCGYNSGQTCAGGGFP